MIKIIVLTLLMSMTSSYAQTYRFRVGIDWDRVENVWKTLTLQKRKENKLLCRKRLEEYRDDFVEKDFLKDFQDVELTDEMVENILELKESARKIQYNSIMYLCLNKLPVRVVEKIEEDVLNH